MQELIKKNIEKQLHKIYPTYFNLLIAQDLWQSHDQILSINFLNEYIRLNENKDTVIIKVKLVELKRNIAAVFLNIQVVKI